MDLWVVAAAAGAGYLTKYWQNISRNGDKDSLLQFSSGDANLDKSESPSHPFQRLARRKKVGDAVSTDRKKVSDNNLLESACGTEVASTSGYDGEKLGGFVNYKDCNVLSLSNMLPVYSGNDNKDGDGTWLSNDIDDSTSVMLPKSPNGERGSSYVPLRNRSSIRAEHSYRHIVKPVSSLESCLMAQLYKERAEMEEYALTLPSSSTPSIRPLFVTDGSRIISRGSGDHFSAHIGIEENKLRKEAYLETNENVCGFPPPPKLGYLDLSKKMKTKTGKGQNGRLGSSSKMVNGKHFHSEGSPEGPVLLCLGISIGIISSFITNKREVDKLKDLLKQTENLVQDLEEELEMKDSVTVKELAKENYESHDTCDHSFFDRAPNSFSPEQNMDKYDGRDSYDRKAEEFSESMSKIEAELEAELERLGLNVNTSTTERRLIDLAELDPDLITDFAQGELRADIVGGLAVAQPKSNEEASSNSTAHHCANYAVSPRELSLRLHEVIQSRLEERVQELEAALENSQRKVKIVELKHEDCGSGFSESRIHSTIQESTNSEEKCNTVAEPLVMNLSGEALDAYNEAYEELMKISESEEEDSPCQVFETFRAQNPCQTQSDEVNGSIGHFASSKEETLAEDIFSFESKVRMLDEEHISRVQSSNNTSVTGEEHSDSDAEMEKQLIMQIVEKTKKGSPVVLNAQRWLFQSMDETER